MVSMEFYTTAWENSGTKKFLPITEKYFTTFFYENLLSKNTFTHLQYVKETANMIQIYPWKKALAEFSLLHIKELKHFPKKISQKLF